MLSPTHSIQAFGTVINFAVDRSSRRRNITIEIQPEGLAVVKAPLRVADREIEKVVRDNARWVLTKLAEESQSTKPGTTKRQFVHGEVLLYLGNEYKLMVIAATTQFPVGEVKLENHAIAVSAFLELAETDPTSSVREPLQQWYVQQAGSHFQQRATHFAGLFGVDVKQVLVRDQKRRWGSCNANGVLRFCYRLIMAPPAVVDYVVAHEVCHLLEMNHSPAYWDTLGSVMPDYKARRHELKRIGGSLVL